MTRECVVCGRKLRTGRKYCYEHRSWSKRTSSNEKTKGDSLTGIIFVTLSLCFVWNKREEGKEFVLLLISLAMVLFGFGLITRQILKEVLGKFRKDLYKIIIPLIFAASFSSYLMGLFKNVSLFIILILFAYLSFSFFKYSIRNTRERSFDRKEDKRYELIKKYVLFVLLVFSLCLFVYSSFLTGHLSISSTSESVGTENKSFNQASKQKVLINSCMEKFSQEGVSDIKKSVYSENYSNASEWIRNNYDNPSLTKEQKEHNRNYLIENKLPKEGYPLVIVFGSKREDQQLTSEGFYFCNEDGIV